MAANGITPRIPNRAQFRAKFVLLTDILMVILPEELGSVMPCGNDQSQGPPEGILQRSPKQQDISQFSSSKPGALASFLSKSHVKLFAISLHNNFVVQLSEWKVNSAVLDVLPVSPVILMERQESWDGSVQFMVSVRNSELIAEHRRIFPKTDRMFRKGSTIFSYSVASGNLKIERKHSCFPQTNERKVLLYSPKLNV